ncbi:MAG: nucleotidyltransferase family protein [Promethearchaeota archaeon]|nr:MAG: nucleotidyltransferase family protein [Candidatus Lokiarchaeota archaeon]
MKVVILCAGYGKRLKPYTNVYQKTMIPVHGKPLLEYLINGIKIAGYTELIIIVGYLKEQIIDYFNDGSNWGVSIEYLKQEVINGTGGAVLLCKDLIKNSHFVVTYGDILVSSEIYKKLREIHERMNEDFILVSNYLEKIQKGCSLSIKNGYLIDMIEKPPTSSKVPKWNNCGIYLFHREIFDVLKQIKSSERGEIELPDAICKGIHERNWKIRVIKMEKSQFRGDFGDIKDYERLKKEKGWLREITE